MKGDVVPGLSDKQAFREELDELAQTIGLWAADYTDGVEKCQSTALLLKGTGQEKALELKELLRNLQEESGRLEAGDQQETLKTYRKWITQIKDREAAFGERIAQLLEAKRRGEDKVSVAMAEISGKLDHRKNKLDALRKATSWYKELLGIRCEYSNAVKFIFTNIDPHNPEREFSFSIHHDKSANKFSMVDCRPHIDRSGPLLDSLNTSNELSQFVRSMRWEFVTLATGEPKV
ncbi:hypothetical protein Mapa_016933 [Marchantia paleacea]|nr:hypothetical protein Mapa_016933 [Marchantia paleacea]